MHRYPVHPQHPGATPDSFFSHGFTGDANAVGGRDILADQLDNTGKQVRFNLANNTIAATYHKEDYNRSDPENEQQQHEAVLQWQEHEESSERLRQLKIRWEEIERYLPPGAKCKERIQHEKQSQEAIEQQLTARVQAFASHQQRDKDQRQPISVDYFAMAGDGIRGESPVLSEHEPFKRPKPTRTIKLQPPATVSAERVHSIAGEANAPQVDKLIQKMKQMERALAEERQKVQRLQMASAKPSDGPKPRRSSVTSDGVNLSWDMGHMDHASPVHALSLENIGQNSEPRGLTTSKGRNKLTPVQEVDAVTAKKLKAQAKKEKKEEQRRREKEEKKMKAEQKAKEKQAKRARLELVKQTKKKHKEEIRMLSKLDPELLKEERTARKSNKVSEENSSQSSKVKRAKSLQSITSKPKEKVKRRTSLGSIAATFRRLSFRESKHSSNASSQVSATSPRRNLLRMTSAESVRHEPVGRGTSQASKVVRAASWAKIRRGGSTNVLQNVTNVGIPSSNSTPSSPPPRVVLSPRRARSPGVLNRSLEMNVHQSTSV